MIPLINLILVFVVFGLLYWLIQQLPLPAPFPLIIRVLFIVMVILYLLSILGVGLNFLPVLK